MTIEYIYKPHNNTIDFELWAEGRRLTTEEMDAITRMTLDFAGTIIDSSVVGAGPGQPFDWSNGDGLLVLSLCKQAIPVENYTNVRLVVYSPDNPDGVVWDHLDVAVQ